jgi:hypothetical protein
LQNVKSVSQSGLNNEARAAIEKIRREHGLSNDSEAVRLALAEQTRPEKEDRLMKKIAELSPRERAHLMEALVALGNSEGAGQPRPQ